MTFLGLGFPFLAIALLLIIGIWLLMKPRYALFLVIIFALGYPNLRNILGWHFRSGFSNEKPKQGFRVLSWNVNNFDNSYRNSESPDGIRRRMINFLRETNADVLLLQEFAEYDNPGMYSNIAALDSLGYKYHYFTRDITSFQWNIRTTFGSAIFSKVPMIDTGKVAYRDLPIPESIAHASIPVHGDTISFYTSHLVSMRISRSTYDSNDTFYPRYDSMFSFEKPIYQRLMFYDSLHVQQAKQFNNFVNSSRYPVIISGDLNSVPSAYVYYQLRGNKKDVFLEKGFGPGTSYKAMSPTLRIDFIFTSPLIKTLQANIPRLKLSDHYPVVADLTF